LEGNMKLMSNAGANQITMRNPFMNFFSLGEVVSQSAKEVASQVNTGFSIDVEKRPTKDGSLLDGGCITFPDGVNISFTDNQINLDALDDIQMKVDNSSFATSVEKINEDLNEIQTVVNDLAFTTWSKLSEIVGVLNPFDILNITIPNLPSFPTIPTLRIPSLDLPEFDFNFCINTGNFLTIENFNPSPSLLFLNVDLGGWTRDSFKTWFERQEENFENSVGVLSIADSQLDVSLNNAINNIKSAIDQITDSLDNMVDVSITDNGLEIASYTAGIGDLNDALGEFNDAVDTFNTGAGSEVVPRLTELANQTNDHIRSVSDINTRIQANPASVTGFDYSSLGEAATFFGAYASNISGFGGP